MAEPSKGKREWGEWFAPLLSDIRSRRVPQEQQWLLYHDSWRGVRTRSYFKSEMFNHFIPAARKAVEKYVTRGAQMLVPSPEFFEVYPGDEVDDLAGKQAESVLTFHRNLWSRRIKPYPLVRQLLRSYAIYSRAIVKSYVKIERDGDKVNIWPHLRAVDPFNLYVYPETVTDYQEATIVFEDTMMPWDTYQLNVDNGVADAISQSDLTTPEWPTHWVQRLASGTGMTDPSSTTTAKTEGQGTESKKSLVRFVALTDVWIKQGSYWLEFWLVNNVPDTPRVVRTNTRPFARHPFRGAAARDLTGEHYTTGLMDDLEPLQALLNDQVNMTLEGQATLFSPPTIINPDLVTRMSSVVFRPRAKWLGDPAGFKFLEPHDTTKAGYSGIQFTMGLMDSYSGMGPLADGTPTRNMPRSGFAISSLLQMSMSDIQDAARMIEDLVLTPAMSDLHRLTLDFVPAAQIFRIPGTKDFPARRLQKSDINGEWDFKWVGSLQSQDYQVRAQRLVAVLGQVGKMYPVIQEDLIRRGKRINFELLLKRAWRDGLGERGADSIIEDLTPQEQMQIMMERLAQVMAETQINEAKRTGTANAATAPNPLAPKRPKVGGGGGNTSIPASGGDLDRNMSRGMAADPLGNLTGAT